MTQSWQCWRCGEKLKDVLIPFSRRQVCALCNADQHVCRLCEYFDSATSGQCSEDRAEDVSNKESANFCDYFSPNPNAYKAENKNRQSEAKSKLDALFGEQAGTKDKEINNEAPGPSKADQAKRSLDDLFGSSES